MALFRLELRLEPSPDGRRMLEGWPERAFRPDFAVAASGAARFELAGQLVAVAAGENEPLVVTTEQLRREPYNAWLPDYIAGFALNLAKAANQIKAAAVKKVNAKFLDEPLELSLVATGEANLKASLCYDGRPIAEGEGPAVLVLAEIGRALQDFVVQLLSLNPRLAEYAEVEQLRGLIAQLVR
jgi:hypothetical protein